MMFSKFKGVRQNTVLPVISLLILALSACSQESAEVAETAPAATTAAPTMQAGVTDADLANAANSG